MLSEMRTNTAGLTPRPVTEYFVSAVEALRSNKERYAQAEAVARVQRPNRPAFFGGFRMPHPAGSRHSDSPKAS